MLKWKVKVRQFAIENMGAENTESPTLDGAKEYMNDQTRNLYSNLLENLKEADESRLQDGYFPITSHRKGIGSIIVFLKKAIRKLKKIFMGWYWFPIFNRQSHFNGKAVNTLSLTKDILLMQEQRTSALEKELTFYKENGEKDRLKAQELEKKIGYILNRLNVSCDLKLLENKGIDYFDFENKFRGSREDIKNSQSHYIEYFEVNGGGEILDIGCGRGEFLELMYDHGILARGVDCYQPFVDFCKDRGFHVETADALTYLNGLEDCSIGGIFMGQVIEHLSYDYILALIQTAYKKLKPGCYYILETPNPETLSTYQSFYLDTGHIKPIHYLTLEYLFRSANFQTVERYNNPFSKYPFDLPHIADQIENKDRFNDGMDTVNELLFGFRDYTLIARK